MAEYYDLVDRWVMHCRQAWHYWLELQTMFLKMPLASGVGSGSLFSK